MVSASADTNIYISGFEFGGTPRRFLDLARAGTFRLDVSDAITQEVLRVLRMKCGYSPERLLEAEKRIGRLTQRVSPERTLDVIAADPSDNRILECAVTAKSDFIVSGDTRHVLPLSVYSGIPIVKVADFLKRLGQS
ncbi:MAG: putative toxin-antitoxin system toxin component, PIN family [Bryobacteraceae bacterium]